MMEHMMMAILPCNALDTSVAFYARLGFRVLVDHGEYMILTDGKGAGLHLRQAEEGSVVAERNPAGLYLYVDDVDGLAAAFAGEVIGAIGDKPWGMYEFAVSDPDGTLVRIGRPSVAVEPGAM